MENTARWCFGRAFWLRSNDPFRPGTYGWLRPVSTQRDRESRLQFCTDSSGHPQLTKFSSQKPLLRQHNCRMSPASLAPRCGSSTSSRWSDGIFGLQSTRRVTNEATAESSDTSKSAVPFTDIPKVGGLCAIPFIGLRFLLKPFSKYTMEGLGHIIPELHKIHGPMFRLKLGREWIVFVENLDDADMTLKSEKDYPYRPPVPITQVYHKRTKIPSVSLGILNGPEWRRMRSPMNVRMNRPNSATHYLSSQEEVAVDFAHRLYHLQDSPPEVLVDFFFRFATESIGVVCYNKRLGFLAEDFEFDAGKQKLLRSFEDLFRCITESLFQKRYMYYLYEDSFYKRYKENHEFAFECTHQYLREAADEIAGREREGTLDPNEPNFLLSLLSVKDLGEREVAGIIYSMMVAGSESTACGLQLLFYALATNEDKEEKLAEELLTHMGPDGHLTASVLDKLVYLKATVRESMRDGVGFLSGLTILFCMNQPIDGNMMKNGLFASVCQLYFPTVWGPMRRLPVTSIFSGYQIPKGTMVVVSSLQVTISDKHYDQPLKFIPERWLRDERGQRQKEIATLAYLPFGFGPRNCIGRRFALQEMYLATAKVVQNYHIGLKDNRPEIETVFTPFRRPVHPMPFTFTPRH